MLKAAMRQPMRTSLLAVVAFVLALGILCPPRSAQAQEISKTAMAGNYSVTLKVLPAEAFSGPKAEMVRDGGAAADELGGPGQPNHHLVVFLKENDKPVEKAEVSIKYRESSSKTAKWMNLPVARMHVAGKGPETTHFGNNVKLAPGKYEVHVTVNGSEPANFDFTLP